jgi:hypothetical protein
VSHRCHIVGVIRRTLWICPNCREIKPTRHESVVRHIGRKHGSIGEPISINTGETRHQMLASGTLARNRSPFTRISSTSKRGLSDTYTTPDREIHQGKAIGSSDLFDTTIEFSLMQRILNQNATIIHTVADIWKMIKSKQP